MRKNYLKRTFLSLCLMAPFALSAWTGDVQIGANSPMGSADVAVKANGTWYACIPETSLNPSGALALYSSTDQGMTWAQLPFTAGNPGNVIKRSKLLLTGTDQLYCIFMLNDSIYVMDVSNGSTTLFPTSSGEDFDAAASQVSNSIFLFVDERGNNNIRRYSSADGGLTWGGTTALVTGTGARPRVTMAGNRLVLNYYGPIAADTTTSVIRGAIYTESAPGTLASANLFQDLARNNVEQKKHFASVINAGIIWFFWTEGSSHEAIRCRISLDNGSTYGTEFDVMTSPDNTCPNFAAAPYTNSNNSGVGLIYYADSLQAGAADANTERMMYISASEFFPDAFSQPEVFSDFTVNNSSPAYKPSLRIWSVGAVSRPGAIWVEDEGNGPGLYFDLRGATVGIADASNNLFANLYPNPCQTSLNIVMHDQMDASVSFSIYDISGRMVGQEKSLSGIPAGQNYSINVSALSAGSYILKVNGTNHSGSIRFIKGD